MSAIVELLRTNPPARRFFLAHLQSSLGTGMGYVALVLLALERFHSPWAVALVLGADLVPLMALGALLGALADRIPRRACAVGADLVRAAAFLGIAVNGLSFLVSALVLASVDLGRAAGTARARPPAPAPGPRLGPGFARLVAGS